MTNKQLHELLNRACDIITSLEGWILEGSEYYSSDTAKRVDNFFNEVDYLNEEDTGPEYDSAGFTEEDRIVDGQYRTYVDQVKQNIDKATAEGILRDDCSEGYSVMSKETWLRMQADQEAQDWDIFGEDKI